MRCGERLEELFHKRNKMMFGVKLLFPGLSCGFAPSFQTRNMATLKEGKEEEGRSGERIVFERNDWDSFGVFHPISTIFHN